MSIKKFSKSLTYAFAGIKKVFKEEQNFRIHLFCATVVILTSVFVFHFSYIELAITLLCFSLVLITEIINTAVEHTWDHIEPNLHPVVKAVKDMMAGAVLIASLFSAIVWVLFIFNIYN